MKKNTNENLKLNNEKINQNLQSIQASKIEIEKICTSLYQDVSIKENLILEISKKRKIA